jgi:hypothetical protein
MKGFLTYSLANTTLFYTCEHEYIPYRCSDRVVVPHERVEGPQLHPARTQLLVRITKKPANVGPHQRDAEHVESQNSWNYKHVESQNSWNYKHVE